MSSRDDLGAGYMQSLTIAERNLNRCEKLMNEITSELPKDRSSEVVEAREGTGAANNKLKRNAKNSSKKKRNPSNSRPATDNQARISFLFQAANTLIVTKYDKLSRNMARNADLVSKKSVTKLTPSLKRSICRNCNTCLVPGLSQKTYISNSSAAKSPHNDVLVHECCNCGTAKRFPIGRDMGYTEFAAR